MHRIVSDEALDTLFRAARDSHAWLAKPVGDTILRAAYLILAARSLGLDCQPIWQFDSRRVGSGFFADEGLAASFLCALGYGDDAQPQPAAPRPDGEEGCRIL